MGTRSDGDLASMCVLGAIWRGSPRVAARQVNPFDQRVHRRLVVAALTARPSDIGSIGVQTS